jgi:hypothetical protein
MTNFDDFRLAIEALSGGSNTVILDDLGMPSVMVAFPKLKNSDIFEGGSAVTHPAFIVNGTEKDKVYVSKYQNIVLNSRAYSLPGRDPKTSINFDTAVTDCRNKGTGWSLMPFSLWAAIALWTRKNGTQPRGNNNYGCDYSKSWEKGVPTTKGSDGKTNHVATGSGPESWYHDWTKNGIADLNGNVWEWTAGLRLNAGEINIVENANVFDSSVSLGESSDAWKAINASGELVTKGTDGSLKLDFLSSKLTLTTDAITYTGSNGYSFSGMGIKDGLTAPELAKALILYPDGGATAYTGNYRYFNMSGERVAICGGSWAYASDAGAFYVNLSTTRSYSSGFLGFRSAFVN